VKVVHKKKIQHDKKIKSHIVYPTYLKRFQLHDIDKYYKGNRLVK